jgi:hypothetical protein
VTLLEIHEAALRRASDDRLKLHMHRLDKIVVLWGRGETGYGNPRLYAAEAQRVAETRRRNGLSRWAIAEAVRDAAKARLRAERARPQPRSAGTETDKGA